MSAAILSPPVLQPAERAALREFWLFMEQHLDGMQVEMIERLLQVPEWAPLIRSMSPEQLQAEDGRSRGLQRGALLEGNWTPYLDDLHRQGMQYARAGTAFASWFKVLSVYREAVRSRLVDLARNDLERSVRIGDAMNLMMDIAMAHIGEAYLAAKQQIITDQQEAIREISTPVLQVSERVLIIPVVGLVDTHRARLLTESLLAAIRERRAKGVVMDITGVPVVDSKVANHLAQACEAARLMGAMVVMTGISSEIALTMVTIGAQLRGVRTIGDLQGGIEEVERFMASSAVEANSNSTHAGA